MDVLREMPRVTKSLGLTVETLPHFSTVCARKQAIPMKRWRAILNASVELYDLGDVQAIDTTAVDRIQASQHYAKRTDYTFESVKTTLLVDCEARNLSIHDREYNQRSNAESVFFGLRDRYGETL